MFTTPSLTSGAGVPFTGRKRKHISYAYIDENDYDPPPKRSKAVVDLTNDTDDDDKHVQSKRSRTKKRKADNDTKKGKGKDDEKRLRRYRAHAPLSYLEIKSRALSQRLTVISRERCGTTEVPEETVVMAGSTGNIYTQHVGQVPSCDCPHAKKGNQCKHIIYVMLRMLKAKEEVGYQLALTSSELRDLFAHAAPIPGTQSQDTATAEGSEDGNRKPIEGECPICYADFEVAERSNIVHCKASCGNNVHKDCMRSWATAKAGKATCPYCRAQWAEDDIRGAFDGNVNLNGAERSEEGYVNVAKQLGLSSERDYSSYHQPWVNRRFAGVRYPYRRHW